MLKKIFLSNKITYSVIVLNAVVIFLLSFPNIDEDLKWLLIWEDIFFVLFFIFEAIVKLTHYKPKAYFKDGWNIFDFIIVIVSLPSLLMPFIPSLPDLSFILLLRLLRLFRLFRFFAFVPNLQQLLEGLGRAFKASIFVLIALALYNFILAVFSCQLFGQYSVEHFGDPIISFFTIFQMFTLEGWNDIPNTIALNSNGTVGGWCRLYFVFVVLTGGIFGLSITNAIFVDEMTIDNTVVLEKKIDKLQEQINNLQSFIEEKSKN
ncbi:MAG: ion transporter [Chitinophagales bacterium]